MSGFSMRRMMLIFSRDFNEYRKTKILPILLAVLVIGAVVCGITMTSSTSGNEELATPMGQGMWISILGTVLMMFSFLPQMICIPVFATRPLTYEKANGVAMSLLATEITPREIWTGKGLAIFVPGMIGSLLSLGILTPFFLSIVPIPVTVFICAFVVLPLAMLLMAMITVQLSMIKSVDLAIAPSYIFGFLLMALFPVGALTGVFVPGSTAFLLVCLGILLIALVAERILAAKTTIEKVILA